MTLRRYPFGLPLPAIARAAAGLLAVSLLTGCVVVDRRGGPPPWAPAHGARARKAPPRITVRPVVILIAGTQVAFVENWPEDVFYFDGRWYRLYQGAWYWSVTVGGEWAEISVGRVPRAILDVPPDYRARKGGPPPWAPAHGARGKRKKGY